MRKIAFGVAALVATQLTLASSSALADEPMVWQPLPPAAYQPPPPPAPPPPAVRPRLKLRTPGWIVLGVGGALAVAGIVVDAVGASQSPNLAGQGAAGDSATTQNGRTDLLWAGTALIIAGVATGIVG